MPTENIVPNPEPPVKTAKIIYVGKVGPWRRYVHGVIHATSGRTRIVDLPPYGEVERWLRR